MACAAVTPRAVISAALQRDSAPPQMLLSAPTLAWKKVATVGLTVVDGRPNSRRRVAATGSRSLASQSSSNSTTPCAVTVTSSARRRPYQSVPAFSEPYSGVTVLDASPTRAPVSAMLPDGPVPSLTACSTSRMAVVMALGDWALMNLPRLVSAPCQISSTVLGSSFWRACQAGGLAYGSAVAAALTPKMSPLAPSVMP